MIIIKDFKYEAITDFISDYGKLIPYGNNGETLVDIIPGKSRTPNTLSTRFGFNSYPFHTDTAYWVKPAKFVLLYCKNPGAANRGTNLISLKNLCQDPFINNLVKKSFFLVVRNFNSFYSKMLFSLDKKSILRYDPICMQPLNKEAIQIKKILDQPDEYFEINKINWETGTLLLINNYEILHSRASSLLKDENRILVRGLIK